MQAPDDQSWTPRFPFVWAALIYAVGTLVLAYPALGGGFLVTPVSDQYIGGFPVRDFAAQYLREHRAFPLWSPYLFGGMPYVAAMHGDIFYPTFLLRMLLPTDVAMTWSFIIHVFLCGLMTFGFLRVSGLRFIPSMVGGLAYMMGGNIAGLVSPGHDGKLYLSALLPLTLWLLVLGMRQGKAWVWGALCIVVGLAVLSPHPQLLQYMLLATGAFALYLGFGPWMGERLPRPVALRRLGLGMVAVIVGFAMGAIQYWPVMEYVPWSPRSGGLADYATAVSYSFPPEELLNAYLPQFSGILNNYWGRNGIHLHSDYIGATVLLLAGAGLGASTLKVGRPYIAFWIVVLIVTVLWAMGGHTPFYRLVYAIVPGTKFFRAPSTILYIVTFSICVLAAVGTQRLLGGELTRRYLTGWVIAAAVIALLATAGFFTGIGTAITPDRTPFVRANAGAITLGGWRSFFFVTLAAGLIYGGMLGRITPRVVGIGLAAIVAADLWSVVRLYWRFSPPAAEVYASDATIEYMKKQPQPGRVLPFAVDDPYTRDPFLNGDALMVHDIRNTRGYHGNHLANYERLMGGLGGGNLLKPQFWRLANVEYLLTDRAEIGLPLLVGPTKDAFGTTVYLYDVPGDNPLAWVATVIYKMGDDDVYATVLNERFDPATIALFDTSAAVTAVKDLREVPASLKIPVTVQSYEPGRIVLQLGQPAPAGSALVVSENYYPGWSASVAGKDVPIGRADLSMIGVELPEGAREVVLNFASRSYVTGRNVTLAALAVSIVLVGVGALVARRKPLAA